MAHISVSEALELVDVSKSTLYRDLSLGHISFTLDPKGKKLIDPAELERFYGHLNPPSENGNGKHETTDLETMAQHETPVRLLDNTGLLFVLREQVEVLKTELEKAGERETKLMDMLALEQEKSKILMLPKPKNRFGWLAYFRVKK